MSNYNLLDEKWIPVLYQNGNYERLGIKKTLADAHLIRQIATSNPMDRVSILRFLLAVLYWCKGNPTEKDYELPQQFPMEWFNKLDENRDCFNLLGNGKRFYQDGNVNTNDNDNVHPITVLFQEIPTGNNPWFWRHTTDNKNGLCPACCALGLLRLPNYSLGNFKSQFLKKGINGESPTYFIPIAETLYRTIIINWKKIDNIGNKTAWEDPRIAFNLRNTVSFLTGITALFFQFWLVESKGNNYENSNNSCILCNSKENLIYKCYRNHTQQDEKNYQWHDPFTNVSQNKKVRQTGALTDSATNNRGILVGGFKMDKPCEKQIKSMIDSKFSNQNVLFADCVNSGLNIDTWERTIKIKNIDCLDIKEDIEQWYRNGDNLDKKIKKIIKEENKNLTIREKNIEFQSFLRTIRPHVEHIIQTNLNLLFKGEPKKWQNKGFNEYNNLLPAVASSLSPGFTCIQVKIRNCIAATVPSPESTKDTKSSSKKKGEKI